MLRMKPVFLPLLALLPSSLAATVSYDWSIGWVNANPDGLATRPVIAINGHWPLPEIEAKVKAEVEGVSKDRREILRSIHEEVFRLDGREDVRIARTMARFGGMRSSVNSPRAFVRARK